MCGIVGIISQTQTGLSIEEIRRFNQMLVCDSIRGPDSTGVFMVNKYGNFKYIKEKGNPFELITSTDYTKFTDNAWSTGRILIGHNRKATIGTISDDTAHPFHEGNIVLVHNGTLTNHKELTNELVTVDSHAITHAIVEKGYKQALRELQGAFTLVWYDATDKTLRFVRNDQRPLHMIKSPDKIYLSSEALLGEWIMSREAYGFTYKTEEVQAGYVYSVSIDDPKKITKEKVRFWQAPKNLPIVRTISKLLTNKTSKDTKVEDKDVYIGWKGYECHVNDKICVKVSDIIEFDKTNINGHVAILKGERIFPNQPPVYVYVTEEELHYYMESGEGAYLATVMRLPTDLINPDNPPFRIFCKELEEYNPTMDVEGEEVFLEEWRSLSNHNCKRCNQGTYWKDMSKQRFKYKNKHNFRIVCPDCVAKQQPINIGGTC